MRRDLTPFEKFAAALVVLMIAVSLFAAGSYAGRGAAVLKAAFPAGAVDAVQLGTPALGPNVTWAQGFLVEVVLTFGTGVGSAVFSNARPASPGW